VNNKYNSNTVVKLDFAVVKQVDGWAGGTDDRHNSAPELAECPTPLSLKYDPIPEVWMTQNLYLFYSDSRSPIFFFIQQWQTYRTRGIHIRVEYWWFKFTYKKIMWFSSFFQPWNPDKTNSVIFIHLLDLTRSIDWSITKCQLTFWRWRGVVIFKDHP
jgi:hypothetical protein